MLNKKNGAERSYVAFGKVNFCNLKWFSVSREAYSFTTDGYGLFNLYTILGACCTHTKGGSRHKQVCTRVDSERQNKLFFILPRQGIEPLQVLRIWIQTIYPPPPHTPTTHPPPAGMGLECARRLTARVVRGDKAVWDHLRQPGEGVQICPHPAVG